MLVNGQWKEEWRPFQSSDEKGRFVREDSTFRNWITSDGSPGPEGQNSLPAEAGRYHLVIGYICPWASRTLMVRALKGLEDTISVSVVDPRLSSQGWTFGTFPGADRNDILTGATHVHELYTTTKEDYTGRVSIPILWDKHKRRIVNNESADILRILNSEFNVFAKNKIDLRPPERVVEIDALNKVLYDSFNNGVYKAGFAKTQYAYEEACKNVFSTLDGLNTRLSDGRDFLLGKDLTESDIRAFVTLIRFDAAYVGLFKTNLKRIRDYSYVQSYVRRVLDVPGIRATVHIDHIKAGYYSIKALNPLGVVPLGPDLSELGL